MHLGSAVGGSVSAAAVQALCAFGAGLLLTAVRARTGSIALPLLAHALINLTGSGAVVRRASGRGLSGGVGAVHAVRAAAAQGCSLNSERNRNNREENRPRMRVLH
ncbi:MAG: type II CAAX prenyl endopeptidase Rce1 family protein [Oscillospiraceae bacterium]